MIKKVFNIVWPAVLLFSACKEIQHTDISNTEKEYPIFEIHTKDTLLNIPYVADIQAYKNVELRSRIEGVLEKIHIKEGEQVKKGQLLFKINESELRIELSKAEAAYKSANADAKVAEVEVDRVQTLVENKIITKTELELSKAKHKALLAKADVALADKVAVEKRISYANIVAPFDGIIDRIPLKEGSILSPGSLLTTLSDIHIVYAYFNVSENEYLQIVKNGIDSQHTQSIQLVLPDGSFYPYAGTLAAAESEIDVNTGNIAYKVLFQNPQKILRHGASGKILITRTIPQAVLAPQKAVFEIQDKNYVFILGQDNIAQMKSIHVAQRIAGYYIVNEGLQAGDKIVFEGIQSLRDGQKVKPKAL